MSKVISFKVPDETYFRLKDEKKSFREIIEPLVDSYLQFKEKRTYTSSIHFEKCNNHEDIVEWLDTLNISSKHNSGGF